MNNKGMLLLRCVAFALLAITVFGLLTMWLWNWLVPELFNGPLISFWQAMGLLILSKILFWGVAGKSHKNSCAGEHTNHEWKRHFYEKFSSMKPEEREAIKERMKEKWCTWEKKKSEQTPGSTND